jgi:sugar lactone lactonase YvrE
VHKSTVDPRVEAAVPQSFVVPGAPKLARIELASNRVARCIAFAHDIAPQGSYLNDIRVSPDGRHGFITDSGAQGAIVVVDLQTGEARRVLDGHPSTQMDTTVTVHADGVPLRRPDGRGVEFSADGIAPTRDGRYLYWQAVKGKTVYRIPTTALVDEALSADHVASSVERLFEHGPADGLHIARDGKLYITAVEEHAVKVWDGHRLAVLVHEPGMRWPDTFAEGPDGSLYRTDSCIADMPWFKPGGPAAVATRLLIMDGLRGDATP